MEKNTKIGMDPLDSLSSPVVQGLLAAMHTIGVLLQANAGNTTKIVDQIDLSLQNIPEHFGDDDQLIAAYKTPLTLLRTGAQRVLDSAQSK